MNPLRCAMILALAGSVASPAFAISDGITAQGFRYVTGGITQDERDALASNSEPNGLRIITVTREGGRYLADARIVIADDNGRQLLDARLDGPWLQVELDPGRYRIDAEFERQSMQRSVTIARDVRRELYFFFDADAGVLPGAADD